MLKPDIVRYALLYIAINQPSKLQMFIKFLVYAQVTWNKAQKNLEGNNIYIYIYIYICKIWLILHNYLNKMKNWDCKGMPLQCIHTACMHYKVAARHSTLHYTTPRLSQYYKSQPGNVYPRLQLSIDFKVWILTKKVVPITMELDPAS